MAHRNIDQKTLAERMNCEPGTVSKLLSTNPKTKMDMTTDWLARFAYGLNVDVIDLYRDPKTPSQNELLRNVPQAEQARIVAAIRALTGTSD